MKYNISLDIEFRKNPYRGLYIALEGIDGCGKTTQSDALKNFFEKKGRTVTITSEPKVDLTGGDIIMQYFKSEISIPGAAFQYFATANRIINQDQIVIPALKRGDVVITDRCFWSAIPYGLMDKGLKFERGEADLMLMTQGLLSLYHQFIVPDYIFYIDINPDTGLKRSLKKKSRRKLDFYEKKEKLETVVRGYRWLVKEFPQEFISLNGEKPINEITTDLIDFIHLRGVLGSLPAVRQGHLGKTKL